MLQLFWNEYITSVSCFDKVLITRFFFLLGLSSDWTDIVFKARCTSCSEIIYDT